MTLVVQFRLEPPSSSHSSGLATAGKEFVHSSPEDEAAVGDPPHPQ